MRKFDLLLTAAAALALPLSAASALQIEPAEAAPQAETEAERQALAQFRTAIDQLRTEMLRPGAAVEGWDRGGADPDAAVRALGAERFYQVNRGVDGTGVTILTDRPIRDFAPAAWQVADSYGTPGETLDSPQVDFMPLTDRYVMAVRSSSFRRNDVSCFSGMSHALLYEVPAAPASAEDEAAPLQFRMVILAMEGQTLCTRSEGDREHGYRTRFFLPDGRTLPTLTDANDLLTIVPAAPVDRLIRAVAPRRTTTD